MPSCVLLTVCTFTMFFSKLYSIIRYNARQTRSFYGATDGNRVRKQTRRDSRCLLGREETVNLSTRFFILILNDNAKLLGRLIVVNNRLLDSRNPIEHNDTRIVRQVWSDSWFRFDCDQQRKSKFAEIRMEWEISLTFVNIHGNSIWNFCLKILARRLFWLNRLIRANGVWIINSKSIIKLFCNRATAFQYVELK